MKYVLFQAMKHAGKEPFPTIYVDSKEDGKVGGSLFLKMTIPGD